MGDVAGERMARQGLVSHPATSIAQVAEYVCGIQAQDLGATRLGLRARMDEVTEADVRLAIDVEHSVVRTWLMRATIHLVAAQDARWLTALFGPMITRKFATRWRQLGLEPAVLAQCVSALTTILAGRSLTRAQIVAELAAAGIALDATGQAPIHMLLHTSALGLTCRADERGADGTFALVDDWLPTSPLNLTGDDALAELARRYFRAYSPATAADFATWSGLPSTRAIALIRDELEPVSIDGRPGFRLGTVAAVRGLRLLPAFDNYLLGYRDRSLIIDQANVPQVYVGGVIKPTVLLDGRVVGRWRLVRRPGAATVEVTSFGPASARVRRAIATEADAISTYLATPVDLVVG